MVAQSGPTASALVRELLWERFPDQCEAILALEEDEREYADPVARPAAEVGAYTLISEVFVDEVLKPLLETVPLDEERANRCSCFLERLLALDGRSPFIKEMTSIRVTDHLLGYPENWEKFRSHAGQLLRPEVRERHVYYAVRSLVMAPGEGMGLRRRAVAALSAFAWFRGAERAVALGAVLERVGFRVGCGCCGRRG
jgi:hypothetical protein